MINDFKNHWIPSDGYTYISNGTVWTDAIFLGAKDNISNWHDTNEEPPQPEPEPTQEDELAAVIDDAEEMASDLI